MSSKEVPLAAVNILNLTNIFSTGFLQRNLCYAVMHSEVSRFLRCRRMAVVNLLLAPFSLIFLLIYFFLRNAEKFYHSPSSLGARRWSPLAAWRLREFNELPYYVQHR